MPHAMQTMQKMASPDELSQSSKQSTPGAKRRPSRAGTRSVSTLTAAQLERKRANDREAQRAIRQRTKDHIETLERRIAELSATNDTSAKLMQALQRNEELEQENAILRGRLNHAVAAMSENGTYPSHCVVWRRLVTQDLQCPLSLYKNNVLTRTWLKELTLRMPCCPPLLRRPPATPGSKFRPWRALPPPRRHGRYLRLRCSSRWRLKSNGTPPTAPYLQPWSAHHQ